MIEPSLHENLKRRTSRGSALLMVMVLLGVLAAVGVAAVSLGSRERVNAAAKGKRDRLASCANAARMLVWAELARFGTGRLREAMTEQRAVLSDGTTLSFPAHYAATDDVQVADLRYYKTPEAASSGGAVDCTNAYCPDDATGGRNAYTFVVKCRDQAGRQFEVEFSTMLMF